MKFEINREKFIELMTIGGNMAGKAKTVPILEFAKVSIQDFDITVQSFDLECSISKSGKVLAADSNYEFMVSPIDLAKALRSLSDETISVEVSNSTLTVKHSGGDMTMPTYDAKSYPEASRGSDEAKKTFIVPTELLNKWLPICQNFVADDDFRPILNGVLIFVKEGHIGVCTTDSRKLYTDSTEFVSIDDDVEAVLSSTAIRPLLNVISGHDSVTMIVDDKNFTFKTPDSELSCRIVEGTYPNFKAIIPNDNTIVVKLPTKDLKSSINRVGLFSDKTTTLVKLNILKGNTLIVEGSDMDFSKKATETLNVDHVGDDLSIGVKHDYLYTCLSSVESERVSLLFKNQFGAILIDDECNPKQRILLMPMIIN